jgi:hypothetical protein
LLLKLHHPALILAWNTTTVIFFLTGKPNIWMVLAFVSFTITVLQYILARQSVQANVGLVTRPLIVFGIMILVTAMLTGGIGFKAAGSEMGGGKRYVGLFGAIFGYYAISMCRIPLNKANLYFGMFFLSGVTLLMGSLAPYLPSMFRFLFLLFPVDSAYFYTTGGEDLGLGSVRLTGVAMGAMFALYYLLGRYGIRGMVLSGRPWRFVFFLVVWASTLIGGFRSFMLFSACLFGIQFFLEGLHRTKLMAIFLVGGIFVLAIGIPFATSMPYSFQRAISIFQIPVSPEIELDTRNSNEWRLRMWSNVTPQIPQYLILGKGFGMNVRESNDALDEVMSRRALDNSVAAAVAQDYHNGPLSVLIPLGLFGVAGLCWFWWAGWRMLVANFRYGDPALKNINTLLLALFVTKIINFILIFGSLHQDFYFFTGILALSVALNGGMASAPVAEVVEKISKTKSNPAILPQSKPALGS